MSCWSSAIRRRPVAKEFAVLWSGLLTPWLTCLLREATLRRGPICADHGRARKPGVMLDRPT
jgi:hypothetical protein